MLFNSYEFLFAFLPVVLIGWWSIRAPAARLAFLAAASYFFYAWWDWRFRHADEWTDRPEPPHRGKRIAPEW